MQRSLSHAGISVQQIASDLDVNRATVGRWLADRIMPRQVYLQQWALKTGVSYEWLCHGTTAPCDTNGSIPAGQCRSNFMHSLLLRAVA